MVVVRGPGHINVRPRIFHDVPFNFRMRSAIIVWSTRNDLAHVMEQFMKIDARPPGRDSILRPATPMNPGRDPHISVRDD